MSWTNTGKEQGMHETILSQWTTSLLSMEKKKEKVIGQCILHTPYTSWLAVMISLKIKLWFLCKSGLCKKHFPCDRCIYMDVKKSDSYMNVHLTKTISKREPATMITSLPAEFSHWHRAFARLASHVLKPLAFHSLHKPHRTYPSTKVTSHKLYWQVIYIFGQCKNAMFISISSASTSTIFSFVAGLWFACCVLSFNYIEKVDKKIYISVYHMKFYFKY